MQFIIVDAVSSKAKKEFFRHKEFMTVVVLLNLYFLNHLL